MKPMSEEECQKKKKKEEEKVEKVGTKKHMDDYENLAQKLLEKKPTKQKTTTKREEQRLRRLTLTCKITKIVSVMAFKYTPNTILRFIFLMRVAAIHH